MKRIAGIFALVVLCGFFSQAQEILEKRGNLSIIKADSLNSEYQETNLSVSPDGKYLLFRSDRGGMPWSRYGRTYKGNCRSDGDIYLSTKKDKGWSKAVCMPGSVNDGEAQDEPCFYSNEKMIIYQSWSNGWEYKGGPYYAAEFRGTDLSGPTGLGGGINKFFIKQMNKNKRTATDGMCLSPDGNMFIFAWGLDYDGNLDLYISKKANDGWTYPEKLPLSTDKDERSVFITADGKTLFFASDGYNGLGGLDIYKTSINTNGTFGDVINIGAAYNTAQDDYGMVVSASGDEAWFVRDGDIYCASVAIADTVPPSLPPDTVAEPVVIFRDYSLMVNYDDNDHRIQSQYIERLNRIVDTLKSNPSLKLEIVGHTDSRDTEEYNLDLSARRAGKMKDYFIRQGIPPEKITTFSLGESDLLYPEKSAADTEATSKNRRCEVWVKE